jgi:monovalent cation/hydrogen antiporter
VTILEGESLINDATALVVFRVAVLAATGHAITFLDVAREAAVASLGGIAIGAAGAVVIAWIHRRVTDPLLDNAVSLIAPFAVFVPAELVHASGVMAVVIAGLYLGHRYPLLMSARSRLQMDAFWRMVRFLLEGAVFLLVGLQLRYIVADLSAVPGGTVAVTTAAVLATVIAARFAWLYPATYLAKLVRRRDPEHPPSPKYPTILAWAGMRGVVTLAAALALPPTLARGAAYPRELFVWLAFAVIVVTLLLQGATLPSVARWLRIPSDDPKEDALAEAAVQQAATRAARERLAAEPDGQVPQAVRDRLNALLDDRTNMAWERLGGRTRETPSEAYSRLRREMLLAERDVFRRARDSGRISDEVLRRVQRDLDLEESMLEREEG